MVYIVRYKAWWLKGEKKKFLATESWTVKVKFRFWTQPHCLVICFLLHTFKLFHFFKMTWSDVKIASFHCHIPLYPPPDCLWSMPEMISSPNLFDWHLFWVFDSVYGNRCAEVAAPSLNSKGSLRCLMKQKLATSFFLIHLWLAIFLWLSYNTLWVSYSGKSDRTHVNQLTPLDLTT